MDMEIYKHKVPLEEAFITESFFGLHLSNKIKYIGKTDNILEIEEILGSMIREFPKLGMSTLFNKNSSKKRISSEAEYIMNFKDINSAKLKQIENLICKEFGFKECVVDISQIPMINAFTVPRSFLIRDLTSGMPSLISLNDDKFYDKKHSYSCYISLYASCFTGEFDKEELAFLLLHEIGHNFDITIQAYICDVLYYVYRIPYLIEDFFEIGIFTNPFTKAIELLSHIVNPTFYGMYNTILRKLRKRFPELYKAITESLIRGNFFMKHFGSFVLLFGTFQVLAKRYHTGALGPTIAYNTLLFQEERFADSFTTVYGYGPAGIRASKKFDELYRSTNTGTQNETNSFIGSELFHIFNMILDPHPENQTRAKMMLEDMEKLSNSNDFSPKLRKKIRNNYEECKRFYDDFIKVNDKENSAHLLKLSRSFKETYLFGKIDLRSYICTGSAIYSWR